uniref:Helicase-like transcription factor n=1 Tax=Anabas testudineus TaxID=64144 RepID=A0A7N6A577_ANATE
MFSNRWRFGWDRYTEVDLFTDHNDTNAETLSQAIRAASEEPDADGSVLFGHLQGTVVGLRYYTGVVNSGEMVGLVRQPQNPYDRNAVMVANIYGNQVGHIKKELAAAMAYVMDNKLAKVEGVVHSGTKNKFTMPVMLSFWGKEEKKNTVIEMMARRGYKLNTGGIGQAGTNTLKNAFDNLFEGLMESKDGEKEAAKSVGTPLLPHQKKALSWMCARENKSGLPPFWEKRGELYYNTLTCFSAKEIPERVRGGILADDMGLGKTLTTIALILTNFHNGKPLPVETCVSVTVLNLYFSITVWCEQHLFIIKWLFACYQEGQSSPLKARTKKQMPPKLEGIFISCLLFTLCSDPSIPESAEDLKARATLIICPLSVLSNWLDQFEQHVSANVKLNVYLYYGSDRNRSTKFLSSQDVVITTYNILSSDNGDKSPLHVVNWLRVVLDEGHIIRNPDTLMSKAVLRFKAQRRWILSGTPIQNSVKDLWMLLAFLHLKPFDVREWWNRVIQRPVTQGNKEGLQNLQTLVKCITLRRTKNSEVNGRPLVSLPEKTVCVEKVELSQAEREEYELARNEGRNTIGRYVSEGTVLSNYAHVLAILMRLRQLCCHPDLLAKTSTDLATPAELRERLIEKLRMVLASGSDEECSVCLESVRLPVITHCAHVYCRPCIAQVISTEKETARCPLCRSEIKTSELVEFPQEEMGEENGTNSEKWRTSSKVQALMANLLRLRSEDNRIKCLVVSQFTRFLTILETPLREHGFSYVRLDGTMSLKKRTQVIQEFQSSADSSPVIMLLSLKAGGVGLNLTAASHVFLMDPAWNPATEEQCIDRCHRLELIKCFLPLNIKCFIVKDSVEENMVKIQKKKQDLLEKAFGSTNTDRKASRISDIKALMEL